ncbi:hypothetical protein MMC25_000763 [Agyrium rufum]|nr:hypothetical protein [Agyrium rufum]
MFSLFGRGGKGGKGSSNHPGGTGSSSALYSTGNSVQWTDLTYAEQAAYCNWWAMKLRKCPMPGPSQIEKFSDYKDRLAAFRPALAAMRRGEVPTPTMGAQSLETIRGMIPNMPSKALVAPQFHPPAGGRRYDDLTKEELITWVWGIARRKIEENKISLTGSDLDRRMKIFANEWQEAQEYMKWVREHVDPLHAWLPPNALQSLRANMASLEKDDCGLRPPVLLGREQLRRASVPLEGAGASLRIHVRDLTREEFAQAELIFPKFGQLMNQASSDERNHLLNNFKTMFYYSISELDHIEEGIKNEEFRLAHPGLPDGLFEVNSSSAGLPFSPEELRTWKLIGQYPTGPLPEFGTRILGIFDFRHFDQGEHHRDFMKPVLQLASELLMCDASIRFIHALISQKPTVDAKATALYRENVYTLAGYADNWECNEDQTQFVFDVLEEMGYGENLRFSWEQLENSYGHTCRLDQGEPRPHTGGWYSKIVLSARFLERLVSYGQMADKPDKFAWQARIRFVIAQTLCHEVMHALCFYMTDSSREPFYRDHSIAEIGEVFGGKIAIAAWPDQEYPKPDQQVIKYTKWPTIWYHAQSFLTNDRLAPDSMRRHPKGSSTIWLIFADWINRINDPRWWRHLASKPMDYRALFPDAKIGYRQLNRFYMDPDWRQSQSSERWSADFRGRVFRNGFRNYYEGIMTAGG